MNWFNKKQYKLGVVLSGGAVRGIAHLGVLKALNEKDIYPDIISGVSAGAIAGVLYADGYKPEEIYKMFLNKKLNNFFKAKMPSDGFFTMRKMYVFLEEVLRAKTFDDLKIPLFVAATNYNIGEIEYFYRGTLVDKVIASASIPLMFQPIRIGNYTYFDGGIIDNLPLAPIRDKCKRLIAVHVNPVGYEGTYKGMLKIFGRSFHLSAISDIYLKKDRCDMFIEPFDLREYSLWDISKADKFFEIGYNYTLKMLEQEGWG